MLLAVWVALGVAVLAVGGSGVSAGRAALAALRDLRRFRDAVSPGLEDLRDGLERLAEHAPARQGDLERSLARLRASLAQLAVLRTALDEAADAPRRLLALYPRKRL